MDNKLLSLLKGFSNPYIVGSYAIYNALNLKIEARDIDIILETDFSIDKIKKELETLGCIFISQNSHGGIKINFNQKEYDIWRVQDTSLYKKEFEKKYLLAEDVIKSFAYNSYQVAIRPDGEIYCTKAFISYAYTHQLQMVNLNNLNLENLTKKALLLDGIIRRQRN